MPAKVKVKILACRNLPVMDKGNDTTDAFVEVKIGSVTYKTDVKRKTLNPTFNSTWFRFEIDDEVVQDEPLLLRVMDYDQYSANDAIGKVSVSLNPMLLQKDTSRGMYGWVPIYDTMNGIRGEINFIVKVELFSDSNKFRQSSCGVQFFHSNSIPFGYHAIIRGFVEEIALDDDPEHDWIDKIRRASASNEARQIAFTKLANQVQRKIGLKAINMAGNAVVGFLQHFDLEKDTIVARGIGTCVTLVKIQNDPPSVPVPVLNSANIIEDETRKFSFDKRSIALDRRHFDKKKDSAVEARKSKSLLSVPSIFVDKSCASSMEDLGRDDETVSMIVRNVEAFEENLEKVELNEKPVEIPKKHDFIHDFKDSIHEKIHLLKRHEQDVGKHDLLHGLKENVTGKIHQIAEKMHNFHLPHLTHQHQEPESDGLISQAMQTILMEKFNIVEASSSVHQEALDKSSRKSSSSSLQSIKQKFNVFQRTRRSVELQCDSGSLRSISEHPSMDFPHKPSTLQQFEDTSSLLELNIHDEHETNSSKESLVTVLESKTITKNDIQFSVDSFDSYMSAHKPFLKVTFADTNKSPLHESLLSLSRNEPVSTSPGIKTHARTESIGCKFLASPAKNTSGSLGKDQNATGIHRRSSDSDLSITPKGNSLTPGYDRNARMPSAVLKPMNQENMDMEYPFMTLLKYPAGFIVHLGATVSARSVKLLEKTTEKDDMETRDSWFNELRMEIRGHAKSLGCNVILGYSETTTISDDVIVLSATGTAAVINLQFSSDVPGNNPKELLLASSVDETVQLLEEVPGKTLLTNEIEDRSNGAEDANDNATNITAITTTGTGATHFQNYCNLCHIPYSRSSVNIGGASIGKCCVCKRGYVPDVILATVELPEGLSVVGTGCLIQASVCRPKRDLRSESNAKEISDGLPFLEYELHRLLINKLKVKGMNAVFRLSVKVTVGDRMMALIATGTAVYLAALNPSVVPKIVAGNSWNDSSEKLADLQKSIQTTVEKNRETYQLLNIHHPDMELKNLGKNFSDTDDSDNEEKLDYSIGNKQTCILEIDDIQDLELFNMLMEQSSPEGIAVVNAQSVPGHDPTLEQVRNLQMFSQIWRTKIPSSHQSNSNFSKQFQRLLQSIFFKLRGAVPCTICELQFHLDLPADEIQLLITGMVLKTTRVKSRLVQSLSNDKKLGEEEFMFSLEEEEDNGNEPTPSPGNHPRLQKKSSNQSQAPKVPSKNDKFVDISPLSFVPSGKIEKYLGNLNFSFIRETQNVREYGGICGFVHSFITELLAIVRAHISALGGNMMIAFYMTELVLVDNPHKNQAQCLIQVGGDAVFCSYLDDN